jgi:hypothetical protein
MGVPGNLGVVKSDAAGIAYAIERDWLIISAGLHSNRSSLLVSFWISARVLGWTMRIAISQMTL